MTLGGGRMFVLFAAGQLPVASFATFASRKEQRCYPPISTIRRDMMSKRQAELSLEEDLSAGSPASKKARVEDDIDEDDPRRGAVPLQRAPGQEYEQDERRGNDILAAADREGEELREAAQDNGAESSDIDEAEDDRPAIAAPKRQSAPMEGYSDLYLDTINRQILDFDFEKLCSVSLSNINVYACLVCGKYFQGRGPKSHAYFHALEVGHHVFINMGTKKVYVLPEGYEVKNKSLDDIKYVVDPYYTKEEVNKLDKEVHDAFDLAGNRYRPGNFESILAVQCLLLTDICHRLRGYEQHQSKRLPECGCSAFGSCLPHSQLFLAT